MGFGPKVKTHGLPYFDSVLNLWVVVRLAPSGMFETMYVDRDRTQPAGNLTYLTDESNFTLSGSLAVTAGPFAGISGTYNQTVVASGTSGNMSYSLPAGATTSLQFSYKNDAAGAIYGTATVGIAFPDGYAQSQSVTLSPSGALTVRASDSNNLKSTFHFRSGYSGTGLISGSEPGLPARVTWDANGVGLFKFADGSTSPISGW